MKVNYCAHFSFNSAATLTEQPIFRREFLRTWLYKGAMVTAFSVGVFGLVLSFAVGVLRLDLPPLDILLAILVSNFSGVISLLLVLQIEHGDSPIKKLLGRTLRAWILLAVIYFGILLVALEPLRNPLVLGFMAFPLILSTGFGILLFGPIRDAIVRNRQKKDLFST